MHHVSLTQPSGFWHAILHRCCQPDTGINFEIITCPAKQTFRPQPVKPWAGVRGFGLVSTTCSEYFTEKRTRSLDTTVTNGTYLQQQIFKKKTYLLWNDWVHIIYRYLAHSLITIHLRRVTAINRLRNVNTATRRTTTYYKFEALTWARLLCFIAAPGARAVIVVLAGFKPRDNLATWTPASNSSGREMGKWPDHDLTPRVFTCLMDPVDWLR